MSINRGMNKEEVVLISSGILLNHKKEQINERNNKNKIMPFAATWMDLEIVILSKVSQTERDKYHRISLICGFGKKRTSELIYKSEIE